ncbi:hypothetical protein X975_22633, partial [Stegodyphus mimosarum]
MQKFRTVPHYQIAFNLPYFYPMKFITTKCKIICAKMKSAKALSGVIPLN